MKNFDAHKFVKLIGQFSRNKNYAYFHLRCAKNIKTAKGNGNELLKSFTIANKTKLLNDIIKQKYENKLNRLLNKIATIDPKTNYKIGKTIWNAPVETRNKIYKRIYNTGENNNGPHINEHNNKTYIHCNNDKRDYHDLLIYITYKNGEQFKKNFKISNLDENNKKNKKKAKALVMQKLDKKNSDIRRKEPENDFTEKYHVEKYKGERTEKSDDPPIVSEVLQECDAENKEKNVKSNSNSNNSSSSSNVFKEEGEKGIAEKKSDDRELGEMEGKVEISAGETENNLCNEEKEKGDKENEDENFSKVKITKENIINIEEIKDEKLKMGKTVVEDPMDNIEKQVKEELRTSEIIKEVKEREEETKSKTEDGEKKGNHSSNFQMKNSKGSKKCLYPHEIVEYLNKYIIGQTEAKKVVANALRQRWRRTQLDEEIKKDIIPKNILMIGPTGVGKTEIARRISMFVDAPFIKVEATKFTEVGFHGKDVDQIIKDLVEIAVKRQKAKFEIEIREQAEETVENLILYSLLGNIKEEEKNIWRKYLKDGSLDDKVISIDLPNYINNNIFSNDSVENAVKEALSNHQNIKSVKIIHQNINKQTDKKTMTIREAKQRLLQLEIDSSMNQELILRTAINSVEEEGIVFIDEIDKICSKSNSSYNGPDASAEGVQRDLLPLIEGCVINTKYGNINTNYILFIASGAFQRVKPNDMLNELQGRLPVHVTLSSLTIKDFIEILTKTHNNLIQQNIALLKTEGIDLQFTEDAIETIANAAHDMNFYVENIGVRRLHTIIEKIMEEINYEAYNYVNQTIVIDKEKVKKALEGYIKQHDLKKYVI